MHLAYSNRDLLGIKIVVDGWKKKGFDGWLTVRSRKLANGFDE